MRGLIISSGNINNYNLLGKLIEEHDFTLCADGGMNHLLKIKKTPDLIIGDLDSISKSSVDYIEKNNIPIIKFPSQKDATDTELAMDYLVERGYKEITLTGVTGTRLDHTLGNIYLLDILLKKKIKGKIVDDNNTISLLDKYEVIDAIDNTYVSIVPITMTGAVISLSGFFYNLDKRHIDFGSTLGISNRIVENQGIVQIHEGKALLFLSKD